MFYWPNSRAYIQAQNTIVISTTVANNLNKLTNSNDYQYTPTILNL